MAVTTPFATIEQAIEEIREGRFVVVVDDPDRDARLAWNRVVATQQ